MVPLVAHGSLNPESGDDRSSTFWVLWVIFNPIYVLNLLIINPWDTSMGAGGGSSSPRQKLEVTFFRHDELCE